MKRTSIILFLSLLTIGLKAQFARNTDYGFFAGTAYYIGDVNPTYHFEKPRISLGGIIRKNYNERYTIRGTLLFAQLAGADKVFANKFKEMRAANFVTNSIEFAINGEFNFVPFGSVETKNKFTPYFTAGLGTTYFITPEKGYLALTIPFGIGAKIKLSPRVDLSLEWVPRRTFTDDIEGLGPSLFSADTPFAGKQKFFGNDNDWFYTVGAYLTIKFYESKGACRAYYGARGRRKK